MAKSKKIAIIGHFGGTENILDGQTVKTKILYEELARETDWNIKKIDTYYRSKSPIKLLLQSLVCMVTRKDVVVLLSGNGMKFYFPLLSFFAKCFHTRVYHDVIGGNLDRYVKKYPKFKRYLNSFRVNWVETESMKRKLAELGVTNCEVMPNFKRLNCTPADELKTNYEEPFSFCTFSRVMKEKGIEDAIVAVDEINAEAGKTVCKLDIYGLVDQGYQARFDEVMKTVTPAVQYRGTVPYDKSVEAIKNYYALLFPTYWDGEGFPGTIVDAFSAGLPVVATDWNCNGEIVCDRLNGVLYPNEQIENLKEAIEWLISQNNEIVEMKKNCIEAADQYRPDIYIHRIVNTILHE